MWPYHGWGAKNEENKGNLFSIISISKFFQIKSEGGVQESWKSLGLGLDFETNGSLSLNLSLEVETLKKSLGLSLVQETSQIKKSRSQNWDSIKENLDLGLKTVNQVSLFSEMVDLRGGRLPPPLGINCFENTPGLVGFIKNKALYVKNICISPFFETFDLLPNILKQSLIFESNSHVCYAVVWIKNTRLQTPHNKDTSFGL